MSWVKVDDKAWSHPKFTDLSGNAVRLWLFSLCWCNQQETDGKVPRGALRVLGGSPKDARALVSAGLWEATEAGWEVHDFLHYQPSRAQRNAQREGIRNRVTKHRNGGGNGGGSAPPAAHVTPLHDDPKREGNAAPVPVPDPVPEDDGDTRAPASPRVPCPPDLSLPAAVRSQLEQSPGIPSEAIDRWTPIIRAKFLTDDPRTLQQWMRSLQTAMVSDWSNPRTRDAMLGKARTGPVVAPRNRASDTQNALLERVERMRAEEA